MIARLGPKNSASFFSAFLSRFVKSLIPHEYINRLGNCVESLNKFSSSENTENCISATVLDILIMHLASPTVMALECYAFKYELFVHMSTYSTNFTKFHFYMMPFIFH